MIQKMTKYSIVLLNSELNNFLSELYDFGMMDITRSMKAIDDPSKDLLDLVGRYKALINDIKNLSKSNKEPIEPIDCGFAEDNSSSTLLSNIEQLFTSKKELTLKTRELEKQLSEVEVWGDFNVSDLEKIKSMGLIPHFYTVGAKAFDAKWASQYAVWELNKAKDQVYFLVLENPGEDFSFPITESKFPEISSSKVKSQLEQQYAAMLTIEGKIAYLPNYIDSLESSLSSIEEQLDYYFAQNAAVKEGEDSIAVLEGFALTKENKTLTEFLDSSNVYYISSAAKTEDNPPVQLKNNFFARAFEPIGNIYMLPQYGEPDLIPYFAPFYMLFFGLCLGDIGYGIVLLIVGLVVNFAMPKVKMYGQLIAWLGIGTIVMPLLSGGFFGGKLYEFFPFFKKEYFMNDMQLFWFGIIFGVVHIVFAKMINSIDSFIKKDWDKALSNLGWSILIIALSFMYAASEMPEPILPTVVVNSSAIAALALILFCSKPHKKFYLRPIMGITSLYDITGVFGDVLSYIRLFGLGTAGAILGMVVNSVAMQMSGIPYVGWVLAVIMLIFGHTLVLALSALGAFVHPLRLTFVEFYKNAEFTGGGRKFNIFRKKQ